MGESGKTAARIMAATALYAGVHSLLASRQAKGLAARIMGTRARNAFYRPFYLAQSAGTLGVLVAYVRKQPNRILYEVKGTPRLLMHIAEAGGLAYATYTAHQVGIPEMLGVRGVAALARGQDPLPEPEAQGPAPGSDGQMKSTGPFAWSRHPLNLAPVVIFWLWPTMTVRLAAFNTAATLYLILGSLHEESRLRAAYGDAYTQYQQSGIPFYLPGACR